MLRLRSELRQAVFEFSWTFTVDRAELDKSTFDFGFAVHRCLTRESTESAWAANAAPNLCQVSAGFKPVPATMQRCLLPGPIRQHLAFLRFCRTHLQRAGARFQVRHMQG